MKLKSLFAGMLVGGIALQANSALIISEVVDGSLSGGLPKFVELTNTGTTSIDLSAYSIGNLNNGGTDLGGSSGSTLLSGILAAGDSYVISYENSDSAGNSTFFDVYGFDADNLSQGSFINGDDVIALFSGLAVDGSGDDSAAPNVLVDVYGVVGVNGDGEVWDYTDGYSFRNFNVISATTTFDSSEWTFGGLNSLAGADAAAETALLLSLTTPGTHSFAAVPVPGAAFLFGSALIGLLVARRK